MCTFIGCSDFLFAPSPVNVQVWWDGVMGENYKHSGITTNMFLAFGAVKVKKKSI